MGLGIVHPEVVTLRIAIGQVWAADALHPFQYVAIGQRLAAQVHPVLPATATDHIVNGRKAQTAGVDMAVVHGVSIICAGYEIGQMVELGGSMPPSKFKTKVIQLKITLLERLQYVTDNRSLVGICLRSFFCHKACLLLNKYGRKQL